MKKSELINAVEKSSLIALGEWRGGDAVQITGISEKSKKPYDIRQVLHHVEINGKPYTISEPLEDKTDVKAYKIPFTKGQPVAITLSLHDIGKGNWKVSGKFEGYSAAL